MSDVISRADAIEAVCRTRCGDKAKGCPAHSCLVIEEFDALPSADADEEDLIIKGAKGIQDGLYNIKDGKLFKYKAKGGTVRTYPIVPSAETHEIRTETHGVCLISKDDAMGAVQDHFNANGFKGYDDGQKMMDRINALPSSEAEWIPCSEKLPTEGQGVLVTVDDNVYKIKVGSCIYSNGRFHSLYNDLTVTAWMPLPTPYKGGDAEVRNDRTYCKSH